MIMIVIITKYMKFLRQFHTNSIKKKTNKIHGNTTPEIFLLKKIPNSNLLAMKIGRNFGRKREDEKKKK